MLLNEIKAWSDERLITQNTPDRNGFNAMITEELGEFLLGAINQDIYEAIDAVSDITVFCIGEIYKYNMPAEEWLGKGHIDEWLGQSVYEAKFSYIEEVTYLLYTFLEADNTEEKVQAITNIVIVSYRELVNMGFDPDKCMNETLKEISSRIGSYSDKSKKWEKSKTPEAKALWYTADFSDCEI